MIGEYFDSEGVKCRIVAPPDGDSAYCIGFRRGMPAVWDVRDGRQMPMWFMGYEPTAIIAEIIKPPLPISPWLTMERK